LIFSELHYFVWDNTFQSTKQQKMLEIWRECPLATLIPAIDLLGPCGRPGTPTGTTLV